MIRISSDKKTDELIKYLTAVTELQKSIEEEKELFITKLPLFLAAKNNLIYSEFLLHPLVTYKVKYYEDVSYVEDVKELLYEVIVYETTCDIKDIKLSQEILNKIIKKYKKLSNDTRAV